MHLSAELAFVVWTRKAGVWPVRSGLCTELGAFRAGPGLCGRSRVESSWHAHYWFTK